ncbi:unnamed protein product [Ceratitis capitata]|uniref:(Mediterranean fruit fly) hypothetical protein n=2 Tax=Ceratitis capitata TaxID=7213 RepID=A0A811V4V0_CERCA|nr:unnamed protein product [Ceratitis capitata]
MSQFAIYALLSLTLFGTLVSADVASLGYNRFGRLTTRLQRQELSPTPYPAAGYRPREPFEFPSPDKQQFFPNGGEGERPHSASQPQPRIPEQPQFQPGQQFQPQPSSQSQPEVSGFDLEATPNLGSNGDHIDIPNALYDAPSRFSQSPAERQRFTFSRQQFSSAPAPQPPQRLYSAPADNSAAYTRQRQQFSAAQHSFAETSQRAYGAPAEEEPQAERLRSPVKSERLTAPQTEEQREEREDESEVATDIEVTEVKKTTTSSTPAAAAPTPRTNVFYYPASAVGFVHPLTAAYYQPSAFFAATAPAPAPASVPVPTPAIAAAPTSVSSESDSTSTNASSQAEAKPAQVNTLAAQVAAPAIASFAAPQYLAASPYLQQYTFAAPAQLQAW